MLGQNLLDLSPSLSGKVFTCWDRTPLIDMLCWIKTAPARVVPRNFRSTTMRPCSCSFLTMAASVRHNLKLGISEFRCVASPVPARAFVPARGSQVFAVAKEPTADDEHKIIPLLPAEAPPSSPARLPPRAPLPASLAWPARHLVCWACLSQRTQRYPLSTYYYAYIYICFVL